MGIIHIEGMEFHAKHGCYKEEQITGNTFIVDLKMDVETEKSEKTDNIEDAVNYQTAYRIIQQEMNETSHLLEHVAARILDKLYDTLKGINHAEIKVSKLNPPMGGQIKSVSVILNR